MQFPIDLTPETVDFLIQLFWIEFVLFAGIIAKGSIELPYKDKLEDRFHLGTLRNIVLGPVIQYALTLVDVPFGLAWLSLFGMTTGLGLIGRYTESKELKKEISDIHRWMLRLDAYLSSIGVSEKERMKAMRAVERGTSLLSVMKEKPFKNGTSVSTALRDSRPRHLQQICEIFPSPLFYFNMLGDIVAVNRAFVRMMGVPEENILAVNLLNLKDKTMKKAIKNALKGRCSQFEGIYQPVVNPERKIDMSIAFEPIFDEDGIVVGGFAVVDSDYEVLKYIDKEELPSYSIEDIENALAKKAKTA